MLTMNKDIKNAIEKIRKDLSALEMLIELEENNNEIVSEQVFKIASDRNCLNDSNFNQLLDFTKENLDNIWVNKHRSAKDTNYIYAPVAKLCSYVDLPCGYYKCSSNWFRENNRGIQIKYGYLETSVARCQPMNNTTHETLNQILDSRLIAYVFEIDKDRVCYLYNNSILWKK
jgi:hypothetical protein